MTPAELDLDSETEGDDDDEDYHLVPSAMDITGCGPHSGHASEPS
jgi:hypothetical protein